MARKGEKPAAGRCDKRIIGFFGNPHRWEYSTSWNGNDPDVLSDAVAGLTHGIPRAGWRCYCCGKMTWDQSDAEFKCVHAIARGFIIYPPGVIHGAVRVAL